MVDSRGARALGRGGPALPRRSLGHPQGPSHVFAHFDDERWKAENLTVREIPLPDVLDDVAASHREVTDTLSRLSEEDLERTGLHPRRGRYSVRDVFRRFATHDRNHAEQIESIRRRVGNGHIRLVATDLDGTLLRPDGTVLAYTRSVLERVSRLVPVVLVTARAPRTARRCAADIGVSGPLVCLNGALTYDTLEDKVTRHRPVAALDAAHLVRLIRTVLPDVCFAFEYETSYAWEPRYQELVTGDLAEPDALIGDALEFCTKPVTKLIVRHPLYGSEGLLEKVAAAIDHRFVTTYSGGVFLEISAEGVAKASAVAAICAERGINRSEVLAFGDMRNDMPLLAWAGRAIAVANAHPDVLAAVSETTTSNAEDGVARALERFFPRRPADEKQAHGSLAC